MRKSETYRNEIKSYIVRTGMTMTEVGGAAFPISPANSNVARFATARR